MMKIAARDHRQSAVKDFVKDVGTARHLPGIELARELLAAVPEMVGLLLHLAGRNRVGRDRERALRADRPREVDWVLVGRDELHRTRSDGQDMGRAVIGDRVLGELEAREHDHPVAIPGALGFALKDRHVERKGRRRERLIEVVGETSDDRPFFAEMIGDGDRSEAAGAEQIHQLGNGQLSVTKSGMHVKITKHGAILGPLKAKGVRVESGMFLKSIGKPV